MGEPLQALPISYEQLRSLVIEQLAHLDDTPQLEKLYSAIARSVVKKGIVPDPHGPNPTRHARYFLSPRDLSRTQDVFWDLMIEGIARPGLTDGANMELPHFHLTDWGEQIVSSPAPSPYDPDGYLARLTEMIQELDPVILTYLDESLRTFRIGCLLSSTVTLGCASEKAFLLLVDAYANALPAHTRTGFHKKTAGRMLKPVFDVFRKELEGRLQAKLPPDIREDLDTTLLGVFSLIRRLRNDAGHPTGHTIPRETCYANLVVFPAYLKRVFALIAWLKQQPAGSI